MFAVLRCLLITAVLSAGAGTVSAAQERVGDWIITTHTDKMTDKSSVHAIVLNNTAKKSEPASLSITCLGRTSPNIFIMTNGYWGHSDKRPVQIRVDQRPARETLWAVGVSGAAVHTADESIVQELTNGNRVLVRVFDAAYNSHESTFQIRKAAETFKKIASSCKGL